MEKRKYGILEWFAILALGAMTLLIFGQVIFRYCFNNPLSWTEEVARLLFVFGTFLCAVIAFQQGTHVSMDLIFEKMPIRYQKRAIYFNGFLIIIFLVVLTISSFSILKASYYTPSAALRFPVSLFYIPVTLSSALIIYLVIKKVLGKI